MWMGIDTGTGGTRALLINAAGKQIAAFTAPHEDVRMERPLWAEQRPEDWDRAAAEAIRPALIWCDQRSQAQVDYIHEKIGREKVVKAIANPVQTGFTLPKLLWVREHEPQQFERARKVLLPKDYIRFRLTGEFASEVSDASGTGVFDVVRRRWSFEMMDSLGLDRDLLPSVHESSEVSGAVSAFAAETTGLAAGTPVVG